MWGRAWLGGADGEGWAKGLLDEAGEKVGLLFLHELGVGRKVLVCQLSQRGVRVKAYNDDVFVCLERSGLSGWWSHGVESCFLQLQSNYADKTARCNFNLQFVSQIAYLEIMTPNITGPELRAYMEEKDLTLDEMGQLLGGKVATTIMRWQNGAEIPGDTQLLLKLLIRGEMPFLGDGVQTSPLRDEMWRLEMSLGTWEEINRRRIAAGFASVTDWIASLVREELGHVPAHRTGGEAEIALVAETTPGGGVGVDEALAAGAEAYKAEHPLPAEEGSGTAGSGTGRKDVRYTRPPARTGISKGKR